MEIRTPSSAREVEAAASLFDDPLDACAIVRFLATDTHHLLIVYDDERPVGFVTGVEMTHPDKGTEIFVYELGVLEDAQNRGIGRALVRELSGVAIARGCYGMWVLTEAGNDAALRTYERAGGNARKDKSCSNGPSTRTAHSLRSDVGGRDAAVDDETRAGHERRLVGREEQRGLRELFGPSQPAHGDVDHPPRPAIRI